MPTFWEMFNPAPQMSVDPRAALPTTRTLPGENPDAEFWRAWHATPYTGAPDQQVELARLRKMQEGNLNPEIQAAEQFNQVRAATPTVDAAGIAQMQPVTAVAPPEYEAQMLQNAQADEQWNLAKILGERSAAAIGKGGAQVATSPVNTAQLTKPPQEGFAQMVGMPPTGQPIPAAAGGAGMPVVNLRQPSAPVDMTPAQETAPPESKWKTWMESLKQPEVLGPLQTFFTALSAPLQPWESAGSRLGRANMLMSMHRNMMLENARTAPRQEEMEQLGLEEAQAKTKTAQSGATLKGVEADVALATKDTTVQKVMVDLDKARADNNLTAFRAAEQELKNELLRMYGKEEKAAAIFNILSDVKYKQRMAGVAERQATTGEQNATTAARNADSLAGLRDAQVGKLDRLSSLSLDEMAATVNSIGEAYRQTGGAAAGAQGGEDELQWISSRFGDKAAWEFAAALRKLEVAGRTPVWKSRGAGEAGKAAGGTAEQFQVGTVYKDAGGNKAKYLGNGKWEPAK